MSKTKEKNNNEDKKVILLAKAFEGDWCDKDNNVAHEIINFFRADNDKYYVYFSPYGTCNKNVDVYDPKKFNYGNKKYNAEYLLITSNAEINTKNAEINTNSGGKNWKSKFKIKYVIKLNKRLQWLSSTKDMNSTMSQDGGYNDLLNKITYGGKTLESIFPYTNRIMPLVTFEADWIKEPVKPLEIETCEYNYQRHKGYIYCDKYKNDYDKLNRELSDFDNINKWNDFDLQTIDKAEEKIKKSKVQNVQKTFLDLIFKTNSETVYTNMLYNVLNYDNMFKEFLSYLKGKNINAYDSENNKIELDKILDEEYTIYYEFPAIVDEKNKNIDKGRMDICATSNNCRIFIENKIESGLNHIKKSASQLSIYRDWAKNDNKCNYLCLVLVPDYRKDEIKSEIGKYENNNKVFYNVITYSMIVDFLSKEKNAFNGFVYKKYIAGIINSFKKHSYEDNLTLYTSRFIDILNKV